eukprot:1012259-Rhodomonas_salina.1
MHAADWRLSRVVATRVPAYYCQGTRGRSTGYPGTRAHGVPVPGDIGTRPSPFEPFVFYYY